MTQPLPGTRQRGFSFLTDDGEIMAKLSQSNSVDVKFEFDDSEEVEFLEGAATKKRVVVSLDFGSTHSGYAYAVTDKRIINCKKKTNKLYKEPTCALFEKTGELIAFGMKARRKYLASLAASNMLSFSTKLEEDYATEYLYFDYNKLKMRLYGNKGKEKLSDLKVRSANGTEVRLDKLVTAILTQLKQTALDEISTNENMSDLRAEDCLWVLTVPAIWLEIDKQFMRTAAIDAGIISDFHSRDLILALEPECAAIRLHTLRGLTLRNGQKLLTIDCGGGTVDFCAIQVSIGGSGSFRFRQIHEPTGGNWGATYIDDNFFKLLKKLIGKDAFHRGMLVSAAQNDIHSNWEELKLTLKAIHFLEGNKGVSFELRNLLIETRQNLPQLIAKYNSVHKNPVQLRKKKGLFKGKSTRLVLSPKILRTIFDPVIRKIVGHTQKLLKKDEFKGLEHIVLVGGFGQCEYLRYQLKRTLKLPAGMIIVPGDSSSVVMTGAVHFGLQPSVIETRKAALTVGLKSTVPFNESIHTSKKAIKRKQYDKKQKMYILRDKFVPLVTKGEEVAVDEERTQKFKARPGMTSVKFDIFATRRTEIEFVDEGNCIRLGKLIVAVDPNIKEAQTFVCKLKVGFTELFATVVNETTKTETNLRIEFNKIGNQAVVIDEATPTAD